MTPLQLTLSTLYPAKEIDKESQPCTFPRRGRRLLENALRAAESVFRRICPISRRTKPFFGRFYRFPAAGNRFSENFSHFPPREGVFLRIYPISRRGKAFFGSFDRFPAAGRRFWKSAIGFAFHFGVSREQRSISCLRTTFLLQKHLAPIRGEHRIFRHFMHLCMVNKHPERNENTRSDLAPGHEI